MRAEQPPGLALLTLSLTRSIRKLGARHPVVGGYAMRTLFLPFAFALGIATAACNRQAPPMDLEAARASLRAADAAYTEAALSKNLDAFMAMYEPSAAMYPPGEATAQGTEAIRAVANAFIQDPAFAATFTPGTVDVSPSGDMGYTLNDATLTFTGPDGKPATERSRDFHVWRRQADASWKVVVDIWNAEPAPTAK